MHGRMAARRPTGAEPEVTRMVNVADIHMAGAHAGSLDLSVAAETKIHITLHQQLGVNRAVGRVANGAALPQRLVLENKRTGLFPVALSAALVQARHSQPAGWFEDIAPVRVVALGAVQVPFQHRVMLGQVELRLDGPVALETGCRVLAGIHDELSPASAARDVQTAGAMAGLATGLARGTGSVEPNAGVGAAREDPRDICVALRARFVADEGRAGNFGSCG